AHLTQVHRDGKTNQQLKFGMTSCVESASVSPCLRGETVFLFGTSHWVIGIRKGTMLEEFDWWKLAVELELQDRLTEAEDVIEKAMRPYGTPWPAQIAYLYEMRTKRLLAEGNPAAK